MIERVAPPYFSMGGTRRSVYNDKVLAFFYQNPKHRKTPNETNSNSPSREREHQG
jgi:hypothetical protein